MASWNESVVLTEGMTPDQIHEALMNIQGAVDPSIMDTEQHQLFLKMGAAAVVGALAVGDVGYPAEARLIGNDNNGLQLVVALTKVP